MTKGFFTLGSGMEVILIMGSCRVTPYVQFFHDWNKENGNRFTIHSIDPFNWNWDVANNRVDYQAALEEVEQNKVLLNMLASVDVFIHEYYQNGGMFNTNKDGEKNIYQFGLNPKTDICIPSFNDRFVLVADIVKFDTEIRKKVMQDYNVTGKLTDLTLSEIDAIRGRNLLKFFEVCELSDLPEVGSVIKGMYKTTRFWHNYNHVNKNFTRLVMASILGKIGIVISSEFNEYLTNTSDMYANIFTSITEYDDVQWDEPIKPLQQCL